MRIVARMLLGIVLGALLVSALLPGVFGQQAKTDAKAPAAEALGTDLNLIKGVGPAPNGVRVLQLHVEEANTDSLLEAYFTADPDVTKLAPIWNFEGPSTPLVITSLTNKRLSEGGQKKLKASGILKDDGPAQDIRLLVTHRVSFPEGSRKYKTWMAEIFRYVYRVDALPASLDLEASSGGQRIAALRSFPERGKFRFIEKLEVLAVGPDGTAKLRYGDREFILPPGKRWPAPLGGTTYSTDELVRRMVGLGTVYKSMDDVPLAEKRRMENTVGDQVAIRFTTRVDIVNRGIVTVAMEQAK